MYKKLLKRVLSEKLVKKYKNLFSKKKVIFNHYNTSNDKNALLSYIIEPFIKDYKHHTNSYEAKSWAGILNELGYNVDIIDYNESCDLNLAKYDLICGFGDIFQKYFELSGNYNRAKTIYYGTGMHVCHQNNISLKRVKDVFYKKSVWLAKSARFVEKTWTHQTMLVDAIFALGNDVCADSYKKFYSGDVCSVNAPFFLTQNPHAIMNNRTIESKKHFLWFGSSGLIHKGLDLLLDYFSKRDDIFLHICGYIDGEVDFVSAYDKELNHMVNIINYGFIDIMSSQFAHILTQCSFIIYPSCSEGGSPSVLTAIGNGGLIPIITKETTVSTNNEIWINGFDETHINLAISEALELSWEDIIMLQNLNLNYVLQNNNQELYYSQLKSLIMNVCGD